MNNLFSSSTNNETLKNAGIYEIDQSLLEQVSGGAKCGCEGKKVTKTVEGNTTTYSVDEA